MSPDGTDLPAGNPGQDLQRGASAALRSALLALSGLAVASALAFAWQAWQAGAPFQGAVALLSAVAALPVARLLGDLRQPVRLLPPEHRGGPLRMGLGDAAPVAVSVRRALDGGHWMLLRVRRHGAPGVLWRCVSSASPDLDGDTARWAALRRELMAGETRGHPT